MELKLPKRNVSSFTLGKIQISRSIPSNVKKLSPFANPSPDSYITTSSKEFYFFMSEIKNLSSIIGRKDFVALLSLIGRAF
jgi:hypothetical protein